MSGRELDAMSKRYLADPYAAMSDEEFDAEVLAVLERTKTRPISLRLPLALIERAKAVAEAERVPYQTLMRTFIEGGVRKLEQRRRPNGTSARRIKA